MDSGVVETREARMTRPTSLRCGGTLETLQLRYANWDGTLQTCDLR